MWMGGTHSCTLVRWVMGKLVVHWSRSDRADSDGWDGSERLLWLCCIATVAYLSDTVDVLSVQLSWADERVAIIAIMHEETDAHTNH